jgi:glycosyltransferase involved in cell wall biosynthesis
MLPILPAITVFTPTHNRAHTLPRLFQSLCKQTSHDFTWLLVDDGSTDPTKKLVPDWKASADFHVEYVYQENRGKHHAINTGVACAGTELFLIVDSDDELLPHAVQTIVSAWRAIPEADRSKFAGIWTLCADPAGQTLTGPLASDVLDASLQELRYVHKIEEDMLRCFVTDVLRRYRFPVTAPGCPYIPEGFVWSRMTLRYLIRFLNVPCSRVYYQPDGLIANAREQYRLSRCVVYAYLQPLDSDLEWFWSEPSFFLLSAVQLARYSLFAREFRRHLKTLRWRAQALILAAVPVAVLLLLKDWASGRIAKEVSTMDPGIRSNGGAPL